MRPSTSSVVVGFPPEASIAACSARRCAAVELIGALQHQVDVGMCDQPAVAVDHECHSGLLDLDGGDDIPDQRQIDLCDGDADGRPVAGDRERHIRLGAAIQCNRSIPAVRRSRATHGRVGRAIDAWPDRIGPGPRDRQTLDPGAVDQGELGDRRHLAEQPQRIDAVILHAGTSPGLDGPLHLASYAVEEPLDPLRCGRCLDQEPRVEHGALILVAEPGFADPVDQQGHDHGCEKR